MAHCDHHVLLGLDCMNAAGGGGGVVVGWLEGNLHHTPLPDTVYF